MSERIAELGEVLEFISAAYDCWEADEDSTPTERTRCDAAQTALDQVHRALKTKLEKLMMTALCE